MIWEVEIFPALGQPLNASEELSSSAAELGIASGLRVLCGRGFLLQGNLEFSQVQRAVRRLLADSIVEQSQFAPLGDVSLVRPPAGFSQVVYVLPKPGVTDPVALTTQAALAHLGIPVEGVRTFKKFWFTDLPRSVLERLQTKLLANDAIEQCFIGPPKLAKLDVGLHYDFRLVHTEISSLDDEGLMRLSKSGQLYLSLEEMRTIQQFFQEQGREPTDVELETIAQTWSEHCSHKTLAGKIRYVGPEGERFFQNMLKETIFSATQKIRAELGAEDWCVSVFKDNAGMVRFDEQNNVVFKVETHNHPSAIEPYGGANTGLGGVIRDPLGTGLGAKPFASTDVFCFASPDTAADDLPQGVLHPKRVMRGVVAGVRDYGNRMGIPTVNGAVCFDDRYLGNPLVFCGNAGIIPRDKCEKAPRPGDCIVVIGGRTGRDGIHGATFSSAELTSESEEISGGAVQIGNAITEKMVLDVVLQARDLGLFHAITDCGAGGLSSAVGEMGEDIGAEVWLDKAPLKYEGLSYTEIWISEAQERMVLAVPPEKWEAFYTLCAKEDVEAAAIGVFTPTGRLTLKYHGNQVADLPMAFLHDGRPDVVREARYQPMDCKPFVSPRNGNATDILFRILASLNVASKEWIIRQYDHEVQAGSVIKPLVGPSQIGPGDAAVVRPVLTSQRGVVFSCGINPRYGDLDTYSMAASAIDEAVRNCVAVGADPKRIAILDNFCWGDCNRPETLGSLVRAAIACHDVAVAWNTPFISGKDSLNNEFRYQTEQGESRTLVIPSTLLISAMGQVDDVRKCVSMDFKRAGNALYVVGESRSEMGGSHYNLVQGMSGGAPPAVELAAAWKLFEQLHSAMQKGLVRACHDCSEGGLAAALAEMAIAGEIGAEVDLTAAPGAQSLSSAEILFTESNSRFVCEVDPARMSDFEDCLRGVPFAKVGKTNAGGRVKIVAGSDVPNVDAEIAALRDAWRLPLLWN